MHHLLITTIVGGVAFLSAGTGAVTFAKTPANPSASLIAQNPNCNNPQTQSAMNVCAGLSYQQADKNLNQVYRRLIPTLGATQRQKLVTAQQAWIKFRDTSCAFEKSQFEGGTIAPMIYSNCLADLTKQRTKQLESYLLQGE